MPERARLAGKRQDGEVLTAHTHTHTHTQLTHHIYHSLTLSLTVTLPQTVPAGCLGKTR